MATTLKKPAKKKKAIPNNAGKRIIALADKYSSRIPANAWDDVPTDLAKNLDHYLYGYPKEE